MVDAALPPSIITRLLEEISWEKATKYRAGGRGMENVLTAEVLGGLDLLPRTHFLAGMFRSCSGAVTTRSTFAVQAEEAIMSFLPGDMAVNPSDTTVRRFIVQPDAVITTPDVFCFPEAKRIRVSAFQPEQLAREFVATISNAGERTPLLLLLGVEPPVAVKGLGRLPLREAIQRYLPDVLERAGDIGYSVEELMAKVDDVVCWISWTDTTPVLEKRTESFACNDTSTHASVQRIGSQVLNAIAWHS